VTRTAGNARAATNQQSVIISGDITWLPWVQQTGGLHYAEIFKGRASLFASAVHAKLLHAVAAGKIGIDFHLSVVVPCLDHCSAMPIVVAGQRLAGMTDQPSVQPSALYRYSNVGASKGRGLSLTKADLTDDKQLGFVVMRRASASWRGSIPMPGAGSGPA
jgi:hypothetical protein